MGIAPNFVLECTAADVVTEVRFNDWPAYRFSASLGQTSLNVQLNPMLIEGPNVLRVLMKKKDTPPRHDRRVEVRLFRMLAQDDQQNLLYFRHRPALHPLADDGWTEVFRHEITFGTTFGRWVWEDAKPYVDADRPGVVAGVMEAYRALTQHDVNTFVDLHAMKLEEIARAQRGSFPKKVDEQRQLLGVLMGDDEAKVAPLDPEKLEIESWCQGRLVRVTESGRRPFRVDCGEDVEFEAVLTRVGEAWRLAR